MMNSHLKTFMPGRLFLPGCAVAAGLLALAPTNMVLADAVPTTRKAGASSRLVVGKTAYLPIPAGATYHVEAGEELVLVSPLDGAVAVRAGAVGEVRIRVDYPGRLSQFTNLRIENGKVGGAASIESYIEQRANLQVVDSAVTTAPDGAGAEPAVPATSPLQPGSGAPATGGVIVAPPPLPALVPNSRSMGVAPPLAPVQPVAAAPRISGTVTPPSASARPSVRYQTTGKLPNGVTAAGARQAVTVTQGLARLLSFPSNILAVFFSDPNVMDARAINARTIAVTGIGNGTSTLAVFTQRFEGDVIGQASIYRIEVAPKSGSTSPAVVEQRDPLEVQTAIESAIGDPRIKVSVFRLPDSSFAARLTGTVRSAAEVQSAATTASFFVAKVISAVFADANATTIEAVTAQTQASMGSDAELQANVRRATGNESVEILPLPDGSIILKADASNAAEADLLMRIIPSLKREVVPMIVIRGVDNARNPLMGYAIPNLAGEDRQLTQRLQSVTGIRTVYAVRTAGNTVAIYGNVRDRTEYDAVKRYALLVASTSVPAAAPGTTQGGANVFPTGTEAALDAYAPASGYKVPTGVQLYVKILDPKGSSVRKVVVQTNLIEITRSSLNNLGLEYGSSPFRGETIDTTPTPPIITKNVELQTYNLGTAIAGETARGFRLQDDLRVRINALVQKGDARVLSSPSVSAMEGMVAKITVGGERPVPVATASTGGAVGQSVEFRPYGILLTMRPTVTDDETIILQIRAEVTAIDPSTSINISGAIIPGETTRSIDTTVTVRSGDTLVMGGLMTNDRRTQTSKVPFLGDLPVIGSLFRSRRFENNETELAVVLMPRIERMEVTPEGMAYVERGPALPKLPRGTSTTEAQQSGTREN